MASSKRIREGVGTDDQPFRRLPVGWWCNPPTEISNPESLTRTVGKSSELPLIFCRVLLKNVLLGPTFGRSGFVENSGGLPVSKMTKVIALRR